MQIAVLSDIHGNLDALKAVLADIDAQEIGEIITLGDNIGYGPDPDEVVKLLAARGVSSTLGNHEMAAVFPEVPNRMNPTASKALEVTRSLLSEEAVAWIRELPQFIIRHNGRFVHGCPPDLWHKYLFTVNGSQLDHAFASFRESVCFVGHTHDLELISRCGDRTVRGPLPEGRTVLEPSCRYIVNIGSVGQPRDGDPRAKYAVWEPDSGRMAMRFLPYDAMAVAKRIVARGIPETYASRLL